MNMYVHDGAFPDLFRTPSGFSGDIDFLTRPTTDWMAEQVFGLHLTVDLAGCKPEVIDDGPGIGRWLHDELCVEIDMTPYGEPWVKWFGSGHLAGWSVFQPIETSNLLWHQNGADGGHLDVFSCRVFQPRAAIAAVVRFFRAEEFNAECRARRRPALRTDQRRGGGVTT
jgi:S-adenosylmethionine/arginine decarboxylase-like enzyme